MELSRIKKEYDKISDALSSVKATGYGVVMPSAEEMKLETPEMVKKGGSFGVKLKAGAPSIHMVAFDDLKQGIHLRAYAQQDPIVIFKLECFEMFRKMIEKIQ